MKRILIKNLTKFIGKSVKIQGWVRTKRDHGKITFIDLRDSSGFIQCVGVNKMSELKVESVVEITGLVKERPQNMINSNQEMGALELEVEKYNILGNCTELPFQIDYDGKDLNEEVKLKYRYLDLRRERLTKTMKLRSKFIQAIRTELFKKDFLEIETPMLTKSTKEGARDFVVPSRHYPGKFYALPQSPQQYKQLLMVAGMEKYFQIARCIRDEDLRADRGYEFTQLDLEASFVEMKDITNLIESVMVKSVKAVGGKLKTEKFPKIKYKDAIEKYGSEKFDMRTDDEKKDGVLSFCWVVDFPFFKKVDKSDKAEVLDGKSGWTFTHNPFSMPKKEHLKYHMEGKNIDRIITLQYDLVCNGYEVGGGSIRAHQGEILKATFKIMGYSDEQIMESVGHMIKAFEYGAPPHGGIALGIDRLVMILAGEDSLKDTIAFPMTSSGKTSIMDAPSYIDPDLQKELGIKFFEKN